MDMAKPEDKTVLVVDDEPDVRTYLADILKDARFNVVTASDGEEALAMIRAKKPDFISLDLVMPRKSGHKLLYELRKDLELSRIPVLIVTAHARDEMGREDLDDILKNKVLSGPGTYLEKPVNPANYVRSVQRALGMEETAQDTDRGRLEGELKERMMKADPEALRRALDAMKKQS
jgi:CheY-like chemotaxis protein